MLGSTTAPGRAGARDDAAVTDPVLDEADQPLVADRIEEPGNVGVQYPVHPRVADPDRERVQCIMRTASRPEPVREPEEILLVDRVQHLDQRTLDDLVLQRCDAERALPAVRLWYVVPARRLRPVGSSMNAVVKIGELAPEILAVFLPCHAVYTGRRIPLQPRVGAVKKPGIDMVEERGEPLLPIQPCSCPYTVQSRGHACPARGPARAGLSLFSLAPSLGSTNSGFGRPTPFAGFAATMEGSDFSSPCITGFGSSPSRCGPGRDRPGQTRDLPVPGQGAYAHAGVYDRAGPARCLR